MSKTTYLVGSVPSDTTEEVFRRCAEQLGDSLFAFPDGEIGAREMWVAALPDLIYSKHPDFEKLPDTTRPFGTFGVRDGVDPSKISFDELNPYGKAALESYSTFKRLRDAGELPKDARFQVGLPTPHAVVAGNVEGPDVIPDVMRSWARSLRNVQEDLLAAIPAEDLVIQIDYATEIIDFSLGLFDQWTGFKGTKEEKIALYTGPDYVNSFTESLPETVTLGYHVCLGTWPAWPSAPQTDLSVIVDIANRLIANTSRRVDYVQLPGMKDEGEAFYAPLRDLDEVSQVFVGIECGDGADALKQRIGLVKNHLDTFGVSHFCGYGREGKDQIDDKLADLAEGATAL